MLCSLELDDVDRCSRRSRWLDRSLEAQSKHPPLSSERFDLLKINSSPLIWLDSCDVRACRAAVALAQRTRGTVHVGQSTGLRAVKRVMSSSGWFGTTLSEVAARADLVVTLGDGAVKESPLLPSRFLFGGGIDRAITWIHITPHEIGTQKDASHGSDVSFVDGPRTPDFVFHWPREQWYERLTEVALTTLGQGNNRQFNGELKTSVHLLVQKMSEYLQRSQQSVWIWDVDDLHSEVDELVVRRLVDIAARQNATARCALLPLDLDAGRVTAEETLLWLTGCLERQRGTGKLGCAFHPWTIIRLSSGMLLSIRSSS